MRMEKDSLPFIGIISIALLLFFLSIYDILFLQQWLPCIFGGYVVVLVITILLLFSKTKQKTGDEVNIQRFEKSLKGKLHHFKCPCCGGIFALKKSRHDNKKEFSLTCPDCGAIGVVPSIPALVVDKIPQKKSTHRYFTCDCCGEYIMVWAEGTEPISEIHVFSCPYCGVKKDMRLNQL